AILFLDFTDGRLSNGNVPSTDAELDLVDNLNAVGNMGWDWINPNNHSLGRKKTVRKYKYEDYWNKFFSTGHTYFGSAHPDNESHDVEAYGSFKEYYDEVSYGMLNIIPAQTHAGSGMYATGIINKVDDIGGEKHIRWANLRKKKSDYASISDIYEGTLPIGNRIIYDVLDSLLNIEETTFNIDTYDGNIMVVIAGSSILGSNIGGRADFAGPWSFVREKKGLNTSNESVLEGIWIEVHEFGHNLGFEHLPSSCYDPMNSSIPWVKHRHSPPHFNPLYKLQAGWITYTDFEKINSTTGSPISLQPSHSNSDFATVTLFGDALRNDDYEHSEYFVLEYRKREGFNRFSGGENETSFQGGVLVWHYSPYEKFNLVKNEKSAIGLKVENPDYFHSSAGDPLDFFYSGHPLNTGSIPNSDSRMDITTGISLSDFNVNGGSEIEFNITYNPSLGEPPDYTYFLTKDSPASVSITGNAYVEDIFSGQITVNDNSHVEFAPNAYISTTHINADASSLGSISFRGAFAYGSPRLTWNGIEISPSSSASIIQNCLISNTNSSYGAVHVYFPYFDEYGAVPIIKNNQFQNNVLDLYLDNQIPSEYKELGGYDNNDLNSIAIAGFWKLTSVSTFTIPSGVSMSIKFPSPHYDLYPDTYFKFAENTSLICRGHLSAIGNSNNELKFTQNSSGIWDGIKFYGNGNGIIKNAKIEYAKKGANIYSTNNNITIENSTIEHFTEQGIYVRDSDITIKNCKIKNPDGASHGIYLYDYCDPTISGTEVNVPGCIGIYQEYGNGEIKNCTIKNCVTGVKTNITAMEIYNNYFTDNSYGIRLAGYSPVNIHDNDFYDNDVGLYLEQSQPSVVKWNNFGIRLVPFEYNPNNDEGILVNYLQSGNSFLSGKWNNFIDGGSTLDIKNLKSITLNATGNAWDLINNQGPVSYNPIQPFNYNAGPGGSMGKLAGEFIAEKKSVVPDKLILEQNYPNPFNPLTTIKFHLPEDCSIYLVIYDMLGRVVRSLLSDASYPAGVHQIDWDGTNQTGNQLSSGVYIYRIKAAPVKGGAAFNFSRKLVYMR
ncbi:MAG: right-handed parallel beta-helix repeat-containing protein, partial [Calditrichaceae bacterium]|nr:right-handed parallel beta-helix repeat-containing protein [Calditrichaceae bacterium]